MMKTIFLSTIIAVSLASAQYAVRSPYLTSPDAAIGYVDSCARFWEKAYDPVNGGYYINVNRSGGVITSWGTFKNSLNQSRDAYGFVRAFMMTGNDQYLVDARRALDFMYASAWDDVNGGWYKEISATGVPTHPGDPKTAFYQHYAMLGIAAMVEATGDSADRSWLLQSYEYNEARFWDTSAVNFGYYDRVASDGTNPTGKSFNATVDAITTHLLHLYLMTGDEIFRSRLLQVADNMLNRLVKSADEQAIGFAEVYDTQWNPLNSTDDERRTIMGHVLKTAWCLARLYQLVPDTAYLSAAEKLAAMVWEKGYDHLRGGPYKDYVRSTGVMMMYGQDTAKAWWQMEQAFTAGMMLYHITKKEMYLQMADETIDFFMKYFVDHTYGDVYADRHADGSIIQAWGDNKGNDGKAAYHSIETGYYLYLYSHLFLTGTPVTLYYKFAPSTVERSIRMHPVAAPSGDVVIDKVTLNDSDYAAVDAEQSLLTIPPGVGGKFAVTYRPSVPVTVADESRSLPVDFALEQNYPNPFNPSTTINVRLAAAGEASLIVYDMLGRESAVLLNGYLTKGEHAATWNASGAAAGVYFYRLTAGSFSQTKKMILLK